MEQLGRHLLVEFHECDPVVLNDHDLVKREMLNAAKVAGATIVGDVFHRFSPHGVSGAVVIAESHLSIHTWPEYGYAAVDLFTCGTTVDPFKAFDHLTEVLGSRRVEQSEHRRGLFPMPVGEALPFKPGV